jgi:calcium permeable stress-gated cation channel
MEKDILDKASEPNLNLKTYLANAYLHPIFHEFECDVEAGEVTANKSECESESPYHCESVPSPSSPRYVYHYEFEP